VDGDGEMTIVAVLFAALAFSPACHAQTSGSVSLKPKDWSILYSTKLPKHPAALTGQTGWYFDFPVYDQPVSTCASKGNCPGVHYVVTDYTQPITAVTLVMTFRVETTGSVVFNGNLQPDNTCNFPAGVHPYIERQNDDGGEFYRWWANPIYYALAPGSVTLAVPLTPDQWSSVFGKFGNYDAESLAGFQAALQNVGEVGMTFGGGCFFGHGVNVSGGTARFVLTGYGFN
jgi:hypothetical protein